VYRLVCKLDAASGSKLYFLQLANAVANISESQVFIPQTILLILP